MQEKLDSPEFNREYEWRWLEPGLLETTDRMTGLRQRYAIPPVTPDADSSVSQVFDLMNIDTSLTAHRYRYWKTLPIGAGPAYPLIISDFNQNGFPELSGVKYKEEWPGGANSAVFEMEPDSNWVLKRKFDDKTVYPVGHNPTDLDQDGYLELNFHFSPGQVRNYESTQPNIIPDTLNFSHYMWMVSSVLNEEIIVDLDKDSLPELVYVGDDTLPPTGGIRLYIAEYKPGNNNFIRIFQKPNGNEYIPGFATGDLDNDGKMEVIAGSSGGVVYLIECDGDDSYSLVFSDTLGFWNPYLCAVANDIDNNGKPELFMGGHNSVDGHLVEWYESNADNRLVLVRSFLIKNSNFFYTKNLQAIDVDLDGRDELVFAFKKAVLILKYSNSTGKFDVFFIKTIFKCQ